MWNGFAASTPWSTSGSSWGLGLDDNDLDCEKEASKREQNTGKAHHCTLAPSGTGCMCSEIEEIDVIDTPSSPIPDGHPKDIPYIPPSWTPSGPIGGFDWDRPRIDPPTGACVYDFVLDPKSICSFPGSKGCGGDISRATFTLTPNGRFPTKVPGRGGNRVLLSEWDSKKCKCRHCYATQNSDNPCDVDDIGPCTEWKSPEERRPD